MAQLVIHIALVRIPLLTQLATNIRGLSSDHNPVLLELSGSPILSLPPMTGRPINWMEYNKILIQKTPLQKILIYDNRNKNRRDDNPIY